MISVSKPVARWGLPALLLVLLLTARPAATPSDVPGLPVDDQGRPTYVPGEVLVQLAPGRALQALGASPYSLLADALGARRLAATGWASAVHRVPLKAGVGVGEALLALRADPAVVAAEPNYLNYRLVTPGDTDWGQLWGMENTGQAVSGSIYSPGSGTPDADVDASAAWDSATGAGVLVAVIDDGLDYTHPDLIGNLWDGSAGPNCPGAGAPPPTANGGCDIAEADTDPYPIGFYHGTHVAGTIAAALNGAGVVGMAYDATVMGLKVFPDDGGGAADADIIAAINYAAASGAHIANLSLGRSGSESGTMTTAVQNAIAAGMLLVVAAGNEANNNNLSPRWPANYAAVPSTAAGVISVAATDQSDGLANFSNYGSSTVSLGAPGVNIRSTTWDRTVVFAELGASAATSATDCSSAPNTCLNNTVFDLTPDCVSGGGVGCQWGAGWDAAPPYNTTWFLVGDITPPSGSTYANTIDGTITSAAYDTSTLARLVLRYTAAWDMECWNGEVDYVDVEVWNGSGWVRLAAPNTNINDLRTDYCTTTHTHTGRMGSTFGTYLDFSYDITAYKNAALQIRFRFVSDDSVNSTAVPGAVQIVGVTLDRQGGNAANAYGLSNGTSMASPMVAGIAALVKQAYPGYTPAQIKTRILESGDAATALIGKTVTGKRANAANAVTGVVTPPATVGGGGGGGCLITWATAGWLPDRALDPLRDVRETLWQSGAWGRAAVRAYYRGSAAAIAWLEAARGSDLRTVPPAKTARL